MKLKIKTPHFLLVFLTLCQCVKIMKIITTYCISTVFVLCFVYFVTLKNTKSSVSNTSIELNIFHSSAIKNKLNEHGIYVNNSLKNTQSVKKKHRYHVPKFMLELYENGQKMKTNYVKADVVRSLIPKHAGSIFGKKILDMSENHLLVFYLPASPAEEKLLSAELKILTLVELQANYTYGAERIINVSIYDDKSQTVIYQNGLHIYHFNNTWLSFNLTKPIVEILQNKRNKILKVLITVKYFDSSKLNLSLLPNNYDIEHDYPILILSYSSSSNNNHDKNKNNNGFLKLGRFKRNIEDDYEEETNKLWDNDSSDKKLQKKKGKKLRNTCRKKPMYINFSEIDYDSFIVQPSGYEAYQCQGKCFYPMAEHLNPTKHAIVQALLHNVAPYKASRSCCVPTNLNSISILYIDNGVLTYRFAYKDMVVLECGCR